MSRLLHHIERWLFAPGPERDVAFAATALSALIGLRLALSPFRGLADLPAELFRPVPFLRFLDQGPPVEVIVAFQVVGTAAASMAVLGRGRRVAFPIAWASLLFLAGLRASRGKIQHNDLLLILAAVPFLVAPLEARFRSLRRSAAFGWPLRSALVVVAGSYSFAGFHKLTESGLAWVTTDNMRWILYTGSQGSHSVWPDLAVAIADRDWLSHLLAGGVLAFELGFVAVLWLPRLRTHFALGAVALHAGIYLTLGLDYWTYAALALLFVVDWRPWLDRYRDAGAAPETTATPLARRT